MEKGIDAKTVRKRQVEQNDIDLLRLQYLACALNPVRE